MSDDENAELVHDWESDCYVLRDEITRLRADLAAVTEERDRMREALKPLAAITLWTDKYPDGPLSVDDNQRYISPQWIVRARAALEGVTEREKLREDIKPRFSPKSAQQIRDETDRLIEKHRESVSDWLEAGSWKQSGVGNE